MQRYKEGLPIRASFTAHVAVVDSDSNANTPVVRPVAEQGASSTTSATWKHPDQVVTFSASNYPTWSEQELLKLQTAYKLFQRTRSEKNFADQGRRAPLMELCRLCGIDTSVPNITNLMLATALIAWVCIFL